MKAHQAEHRIATMCHVVGVSTSGYYAWRERAPSAREQANADLEEKIRVAHNESRGSYGAPRIQTELSEEDGLRAQSYRSTDAPGRPRGVCRRKGWRRPCATAMHDQLPILSSATSASNNLIDCGWPTSPTSRPGAASCSWPWCSTSSAVESSAGPWPITSAPSVLDALDMALTRRQPSNVIHHSDQGCQYTPSPSGSAVRQPECALDGLGRRLLRQRHAREFLRHARNPPVSGKLPHEGKAMDLGGRSWVQGGGQTKGAVGDRRLAPPWRRRRRGHSGVEIGQATEYSPRFASEWRGRRSGGGTRPRISTEGNSPNAGRSMPVIPRCVRERRSTRARGLATLIRLIRSPKLPWNIADHSRRFRHEHPD